ncbi:MAG: GNAT family N-acetyltransferase [Candidatus Lokiarchaeota archaeon]|nr:GNAT family N-acetyltransferase [Candidatus Lokiarchaeota archaeon]MBD3341430.1 GNAT family N-acetyltransferase [Candidatus Lokiarchaeota archaeon]
MVINLTDKNCDDITTKLQKYSNKQVTIEQAIRDFIEPGDRIFIDSGCAEPIDLTKKLIELGPELPDVEILHFLSLSDLDYYRKVGEGIEDLYRHNAFFIGKSLRKYIKAGQADYTPMLLSEIPRLFKLGQMHLETALIQVSPPDKYGFCSYGINVDIVKPIAEAAEYVVAEINPYMPRSLGDSFIHIKDIDGYVISDHNVIEFSYGEPDEDAKKIGKFVASLVEDESTIQMGIGQIPNAVTEELVDKKDLGIHSEVFSDGIVDLVEKGVVTCKKKTIHKDKIICSFVMGTRRLYDFVDDNPMVEFHPCDYCNDPFIISQNKRQVAINAALSVDLTGQVNADSLGHQFYSGIGGQVDFVRGAGRAKEGKPIMVLPSTATLKDGTVVSRIVPYLQPGSGVVITRGDVHYVVTEWGIAYLYGKSVRERVLQMINIAHPDFRDELLEHAKEWNYVYSDQKLPKSIDGRISLYPEKYETSFKVKDGKTIKIRPVRPTDERMIQELHYSLDKKDRYYRFFAPVQDFRHKKMQPLVNIDYSTDMILVGEQNDEIIALGAVFKTTNPSLGEIAFIVHRDWRGLGITKFLLDYLVKIARELNYKSLGGTILLENKPMLHIIDNADYPLTLKKIEGGVTEFVMDITK